jgi:hypothetical protein
LQKARFAAMGFLVFTALSLAAAWLNIQAVRWGYLNQRLRARREELSRTGQSLDRRLHETLSLDRLDRAARDRFDLKVPSPAQIVLIPDPSLPRCDSGCSSFTS